jgi:hypothetical protein
MEDTKQIPESFWFDNVSKSDGKHNIAPDAWEDVIVGELHKPHTVLPSGLKGYIIDHPEAFFLKEDDLIAFSDHVNCLPAVICGYGDIVFLRDDDYDVVTPFFDMGLADFGSFNIN